MNSDVIAITITYNPELSVLRNQLEVLRDQCRIIVVDNGSQAEVLEKMKNVFVLFRSVLVVFLGENKGIAEAQNIGVRKAIELFPSSTHVLTLDQDSIPQGDMVEVLMREIMDLSFGGDKVAAVGPMLIDSRTGEAIGFHKISSFLWRRVLPINVDAKVEVDSLNSSGSLIPISAIQNIGLFNAGLFIDHVETDWCFRAKAKGYKLYGFCTAVMHHAMGDSVCEYWLFGWRKMPFRNPLRHYFLVRNSLLLQKKKLRSSCLEIM